MTDGSVLGDIADEKSPRHSGAALLFQRMWDETPDREEPPTQGPFYQGDLCKVKGEAWIYDGIAWVHHAVLADRVTNISKKRLGARDGLFREQG